MRLNAYSIFDVAAGVYSRPFFTASDGEARRSFGDIALDAEHPIGMHPKDYTLVRVGRWDDNKGKLDGETVESLATALEMVAEGRQIMPGSLLNGEDEKGVEA